MTVESRGHAGTVERQAAVTTSLNRGERVLRRTAGWLMLFFLLQGELGAIWDREWHYFIGRDQFWIPPHILIYSSVTGAGLCALVVVLSDTVRYHLRVPGVDDRSTVRFLTLFHAPFGFFVAGVGVLIAVSAAPLDNRWHEMYGIDVVMWAPFHVMGITGGLIGILGMISVFASEAAIERRSLDRYRRILGLSLLDWGQIFLVAGFLNYMFTGFLQFPIAVFGRLHLPTSDLPLAAGGAFALVAVVRSTQLPGAASLALILLAFHTVLEQVFLPWGLGTAATSLGLSYRVAQRPHFNVADAALPLVFVASAVVIDFVARWRMSQGKTLHGRPRELWWLGGLMGIVPAVIAPCLLLSSLNLPRVFLDQPDVMIPLDLKLQAALLAVPVILVCGALGAIVGAIFGDVWRWNER